MANHNRPGGNNPNGNPTWIKGQRVPGAHYWQPGEAGNPAFPAYSDEVRQYFIDLLSDAHSPAAAARMMGLRPMTPYDWRDQHPDFAAQWDKARDLRGDWYEERIRLKAEDRADPGDMLAIIVGAKMVGRFVEPQYQHLLVVDKGTAMDMLTELRKLTAERLAVEGAATEVEPETSEARVMRALGPGVPDTDVAESLDNP